MDTPAWVQGYSQRVLDLGELTLIVGVGLY